MRRAAVLVVILAVAPTLASAQAPAETAPSPVPDYDGRPDPGPSPEEVLVWIPRIALSPIHLFFEYVVRRPIRALLTAVERARVHLLFVQLLTWDDLKAGLVPTAFYDFGLLPSVGFYFFWNDVGAEGHQLRAHVAFGGVDLLRASVWDRVLLSRAGRVELTLRADGTRRPDRAFQGIGWDSRAQDRARYRRATVDVGATLSARPWRESELSVSAEVGWTDFDGEGYADGSGEPSLTQAIRANTLDAPPGLDGYLVYRQRLHLAIDSREEPPAPGHGVRVDVLGEQAFDLERPLERSWLRYGGALAGFVDLGAERVVSLHLRAELIEPLGTEEIPFTEQIRLGGDALRLAGFLADQLVGGSAVLASIRYRYPVWTWLDANIFVSTGNVFDLHFRDFAWERLRLSAGFGLASIGDRDHAFELTIALGTAPFVAGGEVESVRLLFGGRAGVF